MRSDAGRSGTKIRRCIRRAWQRRRDVYERRVICERAIDDDGVAGTGGPTEPVLNLVDACDGIELLDELCGLDESVPRCAGLGRLKNGAEGGEVGAALVRDFGDGPVDIGALGALAMYRDMVRSKAAEAEGLRAGARGGARRFCGCWRIG